MSIDFTTTIGTILDTDGTSNGPLDYQWAQHPTGILITGERGSGKTMLATRLAKSARAHRMTVALCAARASQWAWDNVDDRYWGIANPATANSVLHRLLAEQERRLDQLADNHVGDYDKLPASETECSKPILLVCDDLTEWAGDHDPTAADNRRLVEQVTAAAHSTAIRIICTSRQADVGGMTATLAGLLDAGIVLGAHAGTRTRSTTLGTSPAAAPCLPEPLAHDSSRQTGIARLNRQPPTIFFL